MQGRTPITAAAEVVAVVATPEMAERARAQGFRVDARPAAPFAAFVANEVHRCARAIAAAKITAE
jgi:hypothetical protein